MERFRDFFTGGGRVKKARETIERLGSQHRLSPQNQRQLTEARRVSRRHFLKLAAGLGGLGALASSGVGIGIWKLADDQHQPTTEATPASIPDEVQPNPQKADLLRKEIIDLQNKQGDEVSLDKIHLLHSQIAELYESTFGLKTVNRELVIIDNDSLARTRGYVYEDPFGDASKIFLDVDTQGTVYQSKITIEIYLGKQTNHDPNINRMQVITGLLLHEFIHAQTNPVVPFKDIEIGNQVLHGKFKRGLKFPDLTGEKEVAKTAVGYFFDEINTQFLAEYVNDPSGTNNLFTTLVSSPVYDKSLSPEWVEGASLIRKIYRLLNIQPQEIARYYYYSRGDQLAIRIGSELTQRGIILDIPLAQIFFNPYQDPQEIDEQVVKLRQIAKILDSTNTNKITEIY